MARRNSRSGTVRPPSSKAILTRLAEVVHVPNVTEIHGYLKDHIALSRLLPSFCLQVRKEFGPDTELSLELYRDPESGGRYPTLYVRQVHVDPRLMDRIEKVSKLFWPRLEKVSGDFLLTTDFRRPVYNHAI
jgi:hypothetical protein